MLVGVPQESCSHLSSVHMVTCGCWHGCVVLGELRACRAACHGVWCWVSCAAEARCGSRRPYVRSRGKGGPSRLIMLHELSGQLHANAFHASACCRQSGVALRTSSNGKYSVRSLVAIIPAAQMSAFFPIRAGAFASISGAMLAMFPRNFPASARAHACQVPLELDQHQSWSLHLERCLHTGQEWTGMAAMNEGSQPKHGGVLE